MPLPVQTPCWSHYATWIQKPLWLRFFAWAPPFYSLHYSLFVTLSGRGLPLRESLPDFCFCRVSIFLDNKKPRKPLTRPPRQPMEAGFSNSKPSLPGQQFYSSLSVAATWVKGGSTVGGGGGVSPGRPLREPKAFIAEISLLSSMKWMKWIQAACRFFLTASLFVSVVVSQKGVYRHSDDDFILFLNLRVTLTLNPLNPLGFSRGSPH